MRRYAEFQPTGFDSRGLCAKTMGTDDDPDRSEWLVLPVSQTRDSGCFDRCNFETAESLLRAADPDGNDWENHRFGHWGPGWFEILIVRHGSDAFKVAEGIEASLEDSPSLDDDRLSEMEWDAAARYWESLSIRDRVELIRESRCGASIFAARRDEIPADDNGSLFDRLTSD